MSSIEGDSIYVQIAKDSPMGGAIYAHKVPVTACEFLESFGGGDELPMMKIVTNAFPRFNLNSKFKMNLLPCLRAPTMLFCAIASLPLNI